MKQKDGGGGAGAPGGGISTTKRKKQKGRLFTLTTAPLAQPKFNSIVAAIYARKKAEEAALREQIVANARRAQEEAWRTAPTVLESGLDALEDFDAWGLPRRSGSSTSATATPAAAKAHEGKQDGGAAVAGAEREAGGKGQEEQKEEGEGEGDGRAKKRQKTMADVVQLHRKLSDLQKTRTELRWLVEQVERLEYEAL